MQKILLVGMFAFWCLWFKAQTITIDYQQPTVPVPQQYKPGIYSVPKTFNAANDLLNNNIHFNAVRIIDLEEAINFWSVSDIAGVMAQLETRKPNFILADSRSDMLVVPILKMPIWLSSSTDTTEVDPGFRFFNAVPPSDYTVWNTLVDSIVDKINNQWGLDVYYEIWNEPDGNFWQGTEQEYFTFFKNTLQTIQSNHPNAKVGGPVVSDFISSFSSTFPDGFLTNSELDATIIGQVIDSCVAWGTPLDFVSWHKFGLNLHSEDNLLSYLNQKLINSGHGIVPFLVSEWNLSASFRESVLDPAYMINYTQSCVEHTISGHMVAAWQDFQEGTDEFHGDYGLLSWGALHKPSWKALRLLNKMGGQMLHVDTTDYRNLNTIASYENDTLRVLVSNYSLPGIVEAGFKLFFDHQINSDSLFSNGYFPTTIDSIFKGYIVLTGTDPLTLAINSEIPNYQAFENYFQNGRDITLKFPGIIGTHSGKITYIDSTRNNVINSYDSLINVGFTRTNAVDYLYPNDNYDSQLITVSDSMYSFHLESNGVALLELYVPELPLSLEELQNPGAIAIYPNPSNDFVTVNLPEEDLYSVFILNNLGQQLSEVKTTHFSLKSYTNGVYYLIISTKNGVSIHKLIKQ